MEAGTSIRSRVFSMANTRNTRNQPLHTWGVVILTIAHKAYLCAEHRLHGPTAILLQKLATLFGPLFYTMQYQWLTILSFIDKQILLTIEKKIETLFPTSEYLFNVIDVLIEKSESIPDKFDVVVDKLLAIMYYVPFLNWSLTQAISILNFFIVRLTDWGVVLHVATEKEIMIDTNSHDHANEMTSTEEEDKVEEHHHINNEAAIASPGADKSVIGNGGGKQLLNKGSFKSVLLKEIKDEGMHKKDQVQDMKTTKVQPTYKEKLRMGSKKEDGVVHKSNSNLCKDLKAKEIGYEDPVLELFATAWHTK